MDNDIETVEYRGYTIHIRQDLDTESPRGWDNLGTMTCFHKRYNLGDKQSMSIKEYQDWLKENSHNLIILPLFLLDHSGITIRTVSFNDHWDSGQVGHIYVSKEKAMKEFDWEVLTNERIDKTKDILRQEVDTYDRYLTGSVYGFSIEELVFEDSCWGYYDKSQAIEDAKVSIESNIRELELMEFRTICQILASQILVLSESG